MRGVIGRVEVGSAALESALPCPAPAHAPLPIVRYLRYSLIHYRYVHLIWTGVKTVMSTRIYVVS